MPGTSSAYRFAVRLGAALVPAAGLADAKARAGHLGRRGAAERLRGWAARARRPDLPLAWFHAASVGEGLQAESVLRRLGELRPDCQIVYTHFSPSAEALARRLPADVADYLPYDTPAAADALLDALRPDLLVFAKLDLWPELASRAAARGTAVALVAATVSPGSGRLRWPARALLAPGYRAVTHAAAVSDADAERLARLGVRRDRIAVLGDPRYDSVAARVHAVASNDPLLRFGGPDEGPLVAGSTWPADEAVVLEAFGRVRRARPEARLVLVPHEPTAEHLASVERLAARLGLPAPVRLSAAVGPVPFLLVDQVGVLAALYGAGAAAYVGGGFGRAGLHSVLEPAAWELPVTFGPRWENSRDAALLIQADAGMALDGSDPAGALQMLWERWITNDDARRAQGRRARRVVEEGIGAADRTATSLLPLLRRSPTGEPRAPA
jgi:3-deoxy-D-manno-octulosonic-acid transferase